jgi:hypothetical protein
MSMIDYMEMMAQKGQTIVRKATEASCKFKPDDYVLAPFSTRSKKPVIGKSDRSIRRHRQKMREDPSYAAKHTDRIYDIAIVVECGHHFCRVARVSCGYMRQPVTRLVSDLKAIPNHFKETNQ